MIKSGWRKRDEYEDSIIVAQIEARIVKKKTDENVCHR